jgi:uncharacterized caspase-like protein
MDDERRSALTFAVVAQRLQPLPRVDAAGRAPRHPRDSPSPPPPAAPAPDGAHGVDGAAAGGALQTHGGVLRVLLSYGALDLHPASINTRYPGLDGRGQLHVAVRRGDARAAEVLLASGADAGARDGAHGNAPLHYWGIPLAWDADAAHEIVEALLHHVRSRAC